MNWNLRSSWPSQMVVVAQTYYQACLPRSSLQVAQPKYKEAL